MGLKSEIENVRQEKSTKIIRNSDGIKNIPEALGRLTFI